MREVLHRLTWMTLQLLAAGFLMSQDFTGLSTGNYNGIGMADQNPSLLVNGKSYLNIHLGTAGMFVGNNYLYLSNEKSALFEFISPNPALQEYAPEGYDFWDDYGPDYNDFDKRAFLHLRVRGPSVHLDLGEHALALSTGYRTWLSTNNVPSHLAKFAYEGVDFAPQQGINYSGTDIQVAAAGAADFSFSYAGILYQERDVLLSIGASLHYLVPSFGFFANIDDLQYIVPNDSLLVAENMTMHYGYAFPINYTNDEYIPELGLDLGNGYSMDLGFTYYLLESAARSGRRTAARPCAAPFHDYKLRIGLSINDIGYLSFRENAMLHRIENQDANWLYINRARFGSTYDFANQLSSQFYGLPNATLEDYTFNLYMPSVISFQSDAKLSRAFYLATLAWYPLKIREPWIRHPIMLYVIPRLETRFLEAGLPLSLYEFDTPRLGFYLRLAWLTVGMDDLSSLYQPKHFNSADVYVGVNISLEKGRCGKGGGGRYGAPASMNSVGRKKSKRHIPCEAYD